MSALLNIPGHKCQNCGECCGPVLASKKEIEQIKAYVKKMDKNERKRLAAQERDSLTCPYWDTEKKRCSIHEARPVICRLFGVTKGMQCPYGNSAEIDGTKFVNYDNGFELLESYSNAY